MQHYVANLMLAQCVMQAMQKFGLLVLVEILSGVDSNVVQIKKYTSLSSKLELKGLVKPETASSTRSTLHLSRMNI